MFAFILQANANIFERNFFPHLIRHFSFSFNTSTQIVEARKKCNFSFEKDDYAFDASS